MQESISVAKVWHQSLTHMDLGFIEISLESLLVYNISWPKRRKTLKQEGEKRIDYKL